MSRHDLMLVVLATTSAQLVAEVRWRRRCARRERLAAAAVVDVEKS